MREGRKCESGVAGGGRVKEIYIVLSGTSLDKAYNENIKK